MHPYTIKLWKSPRIDFPHLENSPSIGRCGFLRSGESQSGTKRASCCGFFFHPMQQKHVITGPKLGSKLSNLLRRYILSSLNHSFPSQPDRKSLTPIKIAFSPHAFCGSWPFGGEILFLGLVSSCGLRKVGILNLGFDCYFEKFQSSAASTILWGIWVLNCLGCLVVKFSLYWEMGTLLLSEIKKQASSFLQERYKSARLVLTDVTKAEL